MNNVGGNAFVNPIFQIDTSRSNVNKTMNPSIQNYTISSKQAERQEIADNGRSPAAVGNTEAARASDSAGSTRTAGLEQAGRTAGPTSIKVPEKRQKTGDLRTDNVGTDNAKPEDSGFKLEFTAESMMNGIILSEVLGKPKILQKRRW